MKNLSRTDKMILWGLAIIFILFAYYQFFILPFTTKISDTKVSIEEKQLLSDKIKNMEIQNKKLKSEIVKLSEEYEKSKQLIPVDIRDPEIQKDLQTMGVNSAVDLKSLVFGGESIFVLNKKDTSAANAQPVKGSLMVIPVSLSFSGTYANCMKFIQTIEESKRISELSNINIFKDQSGIVNVSVSVNYYFIKGDEEDKKNIEFDFTKPGEGKTDLFN